MYKGRWRFTPEVRDIAITSKRKIYSWKTRESRKGLQGVSVAGGGTVGSARVSPGCSGGWEFGINEVVNWPLKEEADEPRLEAEELFSMGQDREEFSRRKRA